MRRWFGGSLEGQYVGHAAGQGLGARATRYETRIYQAVIRDVEWTDEPQASDMGEPVPRALDDGTYYQAQLTHTQLLGAADSGGALLGEVRDIYLRAPRRSYPIRHEGRIYGRVEGEVEGWLELPEPPPPPPEPEPVVARELPLSAAAQPVHELPPADAEANEPQQLPLTPSSPGEIPQAPEATAPEQPPEARPGPPTALRRPLPLALLAAIVAMMLLATTGAGYGALWAIFLVPTLLLRRLLRGVVEDGNAIRAFSTLLVALQLVCALMLLSEWLSTDCKALHALPLFGLAGGVFLAGLMPSQIPLALNGALLALTLWGYGGPVGKRCEPPPRAAQPTLPSVQNPGVPRTNPDGTWPRQP